MFGSKHRETHILDKIKQTPNGPARPHSLQSQLQLIPARFRFRGGMVVPRTGVLIPFLLRETHNCVTHHLRPVEFPATDVINPIGIGAGAWRVGCENYRHNLASSLSNVVNILTITVSNTPSSPEEGHQYGGGGKSNRIHPRGRSESIERRRDASGSQSRAMS